MLLINNTPYTDQRQTRMRLCLFHCLCRLGAHEARDPNRINRSLNGCVHFGVVLPRSFWPSGFSISTHHMVFSGSGSGAMAWMS